MMPSMPGARIVLISWISVALFALTAVPVALGGDAFEGVAVAYALVAFAVAIPLWLAVFVLAVKRLVADDGASIDVPGLFFLSSTATKQQRRQLLAPVLVSCVLAAATGASEPFGVLIPMFPLGLVGWWAVRHGTFRPRAESRTPPPS